MDNIYEKLRILADSAKYDVSCSTSGVGRENGGKRGNAVAAGICHSWSADGRCISLLKVLFTNKCVYDCQYCVNRRTQDVARAGFEPEELASLTMEFYRRNYIEGLFLSSAVEVSPDYTAERILKCLKLLRSEHGFSGYIHAKIIPGVSAQLVHEIGLVADRLSVNIELPSKDSLSLLAPQKKAEGIFSPMKQITQTLTERGLLRGPGTMFKKDGLVPSGANQIIVKDTRHNRKEVFAPAGQTTQMIIGAGPETDRQIVKMSESLYHRFKMKRVYFSAYIAISDSPLLPARFTPPPLKREHRLYQADWLLRFYGFTADEIAGDDSPFLDEDLDPKISWALRNLDRFPIEINKASMEELLRIPGVGATSAKRIIRQRRYAAVRFDDLKKIGVVVKRARFFITCVGRYYGGKDLIPEYIRKEALNSESIRNSLLPIDTEVQISMFGGLENKRIAENVKQETLAGGKYDKKIKSVHGPAAETKILAKKGNGAQSNGGLLI